MTTGTVPKLFIPILRKSLDDQGALRVMEAISVSVEHDDRGFVESVFSEDLGIEVLVMPQPTLRVRHEPICEHQMSINSVNFYSEIHSACKEGNYKPFRGELIASLEFPLTRQNVLDRLDIPSRSVRIPKRGLRFDDYFFSDFSFRFSYLSDTDNVSFASLMMPAPSQRATGLLRDGMTLDERLEFITDERLTNWELRRHAYEQILGPALRAYPGLVSLSGPTIDILEFDNGDGNRILVTSGMSDRRMDTPKGFERAKRVELMMYTLDSRNDYLCRLENAAEFPFENRRAIQYGDRIEWWTSRIPDSILSSDIFLKSVIKEHRDLAIEIEGDPVELLWLVPITKAEHEFVKENGAQELLYLFDRVEHPLIFDEFRKSYI